MEWIYGTKGVDKLNGTSEKDNIWADKGNDYIAGSPGSDLVHGESGSDTMLYDGMEGITGLKVQIRGDDTSVIKLEDPARNNVLNNEHQWTQRDELYSVENVVGSKGADTFIVSKLSGERFIDGSEGNNTLELNIGEQFKDFVLIKSEGKFPEGHPLQGKPYEGFVTDGKDNFLYFNNIDEFKNYDKTINGIEDVLMPLQEAVKMLAEDQNALNTLAKETGESSAAREALNDPEPQTMIANLHEAGIDNLNVKISDDMSIDERVNSVLEAGRVATQEAGLSLPEDGRDIQEPEISAYKDDALENDDSLGLA